jgi:hypothetical protein
MRRVLLLPVLLWVGCDVLPEKRDEPVIPATKTTPEAEGTLATSSRDRTIPGRRRDDPGSTVQRTTPVEELPFVLTEEHSASSTAMSVPVVDAEPNVPTQTLQSFLEHMYGVELPVGSSPYLLSPTIGPPPYELPVGPASGTSVQRFPREILVTANESEVYANYYKTADVRCDRVTEGTEPPPSPPAGVRRNCTAVWAEQDSGIEREDVFLVDPLLRQLSDLMTSRDRVLRGLSPEARQWGLDCDFYTLVMHRDLTYGLMVQLVHTAALADLGRFRLVIKGAEDLLGYIPIVLPELDANQQRQALVAGNPQFRVLAAGTTGSLEVGFVGFAGSKFPEQLSALAMNSLPGCYPEDLSWLRPNAGAAQRKAASDALMKHARQIMASHADLLGLKTLAEPGAEPNTEFSPKTAVGVAPGLTVKGAQPSGRVTDGIPEDALRVESIRRLEAPGWEFPIPLVYMDEEKVHAVLLGPGGLVVAHSILSREDREGMDRFLAPAEGQVLLFGAHTRTTIRDVVAVLSHLTHRCAVTSMSGRCRRTEPRFPTVYLVLSPTNRFTLPVPPPQPEGEASGASVE